MNEIEKNKPKDTATKTNKSPVINTKTSASQKPEDGSKKSGSVKAAQPAHVTPGAVASHVKSTKKASHKVGYKTEHPKAADGAINRTPPNMR